MPLAPSGPQRPNTTTLAPPATGLAAPKPSGLAAPKPGGLAAPTLPAPLTRVTPATNAAPATSGAPLPAQKVAAARARYSQDGQAAMSKPQLLVALYQRLVRDLVAGEQNIIDRDFEKASRNLQHAQDIVLALEEALDRDAWAAAEQLGALYSYVYRQLLQANVAKDRSLVVECRSLIEPLVEAWVAAAGEVAAGGRSTVDTHELSAHAVGA